MFASPILKSLTQGKFGVHSDGNLAIYFSDDVQETGKTVCHCDGAQNCDVIVKEGPDQLIS